MANGKAGRPRKYATPEQAKRAKLEQIKKHNANDPKRNYFQYKSKAKNFITKKSSLKDLEYLKELINKRIDELKSDN